MKKNTAEAKVIKIICLGNGHLVGLGGGLIRTVELAKKFHASNFTVFVVCSPGAAHLFQEILPKTQIEIFTGFLSKHLPKNMLFGMMLFYLETFFYFPKNSSKAHAYYCQSEYVWDVLPAIRHARRDTKDIFVMFHHLIRPDISSLCSSMFGSILGQTLGIFLIKKRKLNVLCYEGPAGEEVSNLTKKFASSVFKVRNGISRPAVSNKSIPNEFKNFVEKNKCLVFVGGLRPQKGLEIFDDFMNTLLENVPKIRVILIGRTSKEITQKLIAKYPKNLTVTGPLKNIEALSIVNASGLAFLPSTTEGFGIFPLECIEQETPIVCFPLPVLKSTFGDKIIYADKLNGSSLANKISELVRNCDLYEFHKFKLKTNETKIFIKNYSWNEVLENDLGIMGFK